MTDAAEPNVQNITIERFTIGFVNNDSALIDNPHATIAERHEFILTTLKEARELKFYESHEAMFQRVYASGSDAEVAAAADLARLHYFFFMTLYNNQIGRAHVNIFRATDAEKWMIKLTDRFRQTTHDEIDLDERTFKAATPPQKVTHTWLN